MALLIGFFLLSIFFSFLCSIWEAVLLSVTPSYIKRKEKDSPKIGALLAELKKDIDKPLSGILTLNTIAHTVGAIGVGAQAGEVFGSESASLFGLSVSYESIIATLMTLGILILSEIIPKTIGANNWQGLAPITARSLKVLTIILGPLLWPISKLTKLLKKDKSRSVFSKQDFAAMAEVVNESGEIESEDLELIRNVLQFDDLTAKDVMTPRNVMITAKEDQILSEFYKNYQPFVFSRIPVYSDKGEITGMILKDQLLQQMVEGNGNNKLSSIRRSVQTLASDTSLRDIFQRINRQDGHLALVADEYGTILGLVTLEDVIETLFGLEIMDETDTIDDLQAHARKIWETRAKKLGLIPKEDSQNL